MQSITILPGKLLVSLFVVITIFLAPLTAKAVTVDDLLIQVQSMMEQMAKMQAQLIELKKNGGLTTDNTKKESTTTAVNPGSVLGVKKFKFTQEIVYGATNDDIKKIQELLKIDKEIYPEGITSGFFGPATQRAVRNLQTKFGLDPVGVVGPATTALLERLISQQNNDGTYPADILDPTRPTGSVLGVTTSTLTQNPLVQQLLDQVTKLQSQQNTNKTNSTFSDGSNITKITVEIDDGESLVKVFYKNGSIKDFWVTEDKKTDIVKAISEEIKINESEVDALTSFKKFGKGVSQDDIDEILADVDLENKETNISVVFDSGDDDSFVVDSVNYNDIIEAVADELDIDKNDTRDIIEFDWNIRVKDIKVIEVTVKNGEANVTVRLTSGNKIRFVIEENKESRIIKEIAHILDINEDEVDNLLEIDFN